MSKLYVFFDLLVSDLEELEEDQNSSCVLPETLKVISDTPRIIFFWIFITISIASLLGNICVILTVTKRKCRHLQKASIISLAVSDILSTITIATNNVETFSHPLINWTLGSFLCFFIPMGQFSGITASSVALVVIAMDRYKSIHSIGEKWNPNRYHCFIATLVLWILSLALSYPMFTLYSHKPIRIVFINKKFPEFHPAYLCISFKKKTIELYYILMIILIFFPLLIIFVWFNYNIALLIWHHRKPLANKQTSSSESTSECNEVVLRRNFRVERKIRLFKIILALMLIFIMCRLPFYVFFILKLIYEYNGELVWCVNYALIALNVSNSALNPLLYTFLNPTLNFLMKTRRATKRFLCEICCCCFSDTEFEGFERDNPFTVENFQHQL